MKIGKSAILVCENFKAETEEALKSEGLDNFDIITFPAHCHKVQQMQCSFVCEFPEAGAVNYDSIHTISSNCVLHRKGMEEHCHKCKFHSLPMCHYMFADKKTINAYLQEGGYLLTPGWLQKWPKYLAEWGFSDEVAVEFFRESTDKLILLDTGVFEDSKSRLEAFAAKVKRPFEIVPVGLNKFRKFLNESLGTFHLKPLNNNSQPKETYKEYTRKLADYALIFDLIENLALFRDEDEIIGRIMDIFETLCASSSVSYLPIYEGSFGALKTSTLAPNNTSRIKERLAAFNEVDGWKKLDDGFMLQIRYRAKPVGVLEVAQISFPKFNEHYLNMGINIANVLGLCISNARTYHDLEKQVEERTNELMETNKNLEDEISKRKRIQDALTKSEKQYHDLYDNSPDMFCSVEVPSGNIIRCNDTLARKLGYSKKEIIGRHISFVYHQDCEEKREEAFQNFIKTGKVENTELQLKRKDGKKIDVLLNASAVRDKNGKILHSRSSWTDITKRKSAENERERFFNVSTDILCIAGLDGFFKQVNPSFERITGFSVDELTTRPFLEFVHPDDREKTISEVKKQEQGKQTISFENRYVCKDGSIKYLLWNAISIAEEGLIYAVAHDITDRKKEEHELIKAKEKAEEATILKDKFVSLVSHDLKSPLSTMLGFLKLIKDESVEPVNEGAKLILENAISSGNSMARLIDDLLNISRLTSGQLKIDMKFNDANYIGLKMISDFTYLAEQKGITLKNEIPKHSRIYCDLTLLTEAVQNLITNAVKFCSRGDKITLYLAEEDKSTICVKDTGRGMDQSDIKELFEFKSKLSKLGTAGEIGTGLGLPLANEIMQIQGGTLTGECQIGEGCTFKVKLPYKKPVILLVDDDPAFRFLQCQYLMKIGVEIIEAENGKAALEKIGRLTPHLIITDIEMPEMNGLELLTVIKNRETTKNIPVIAVSGVHGMEIRDSVFGRGGEDFITKSAGPEEFIPRVRRFIS